MMASRYRRATEVRGSADTGTYCEVAGLMSRPILGTYAVIVSGAAISAVSAGDLDNVAAPHTF